METNIVSSNFPQKEPILTITIVYLNVAFRIAGYFSMAMLLLTIISIFLFENNLLWRLFGFITILGFAYTSFKSYKTKGQIEFYSNYMRILNKTYCNNLSFNRVKRIAIEINDFKGQERLVFNPMMKHKCEGISNYIIVTEDDTTTKLQVLLTKKNLILLDKTLPAILRQFPIDYIMKYKGKEIANLPMIWGTGNNCSISACN